MIVWQCDQMAKLFFQYLAIYNIGHLPNTIWNLPKCVQNCAKYLKKHFKFCQSHLKICPSGEISPNLVTLLCGDVSLRLGGWVSVYEVVHLSMRKGVHSYVRTSVTRSGNLLDFDQLLNAFGNGNYYTLDNHSNPLATINLPNLLYS